MGPLVDTYPTRGHVRSELTIRQQARPYFSNPLLQAILEGKLLYPVHLRHKLIAIVPHQEAPQEELFRELPPVSLFPSPPAFPPFVSLLHLLLGLFLPTRERGLMFMDEGTELGDTSEAQKE